VPRHRTSRCHSDCLIAAVNTVLGLVAVRGWTRSAVTSTGHLVMYGGISGGMWMTQRTAMINDVNVDPTTLVFAAFQPKYSTHIGSQDF